jgi:uncharacterized damage-inducible protein DinB
MADTPDIKAQVLAAIDDNWRGLRKALAPLTSADMEAPGVSGSWSVKDILGHITTWENEVIRALRGEQRTYSPNVDAFNELDVRRKSKLPPREVMVEFEDVHRALREALGHAPETHFKFGTSLRKTIDEDTVLHYQEHVRDVRLWARKRKLGQAEGS